MVGDRENLQRVPRSPQVALPVGLVVAKGENLPARAEESDWKSDLSVVMTTDPVAGLSGKMAPTGP